LQRILERGKTRNSSKPQVANVRNPNAKIRIFKTKNESATERQMPEKYGTVGAVALDKNGNMAAGTSTGGMTNKKYGRVGDAPIIGAGTIANNDSCGVSATGWGEYFIRVGVARDIAALMEYRALDVQHGRGYGPQKGRQLGRRRRRHRYGQIRKYGNFLQFRRDVPRLHKRRRQAGGRNL
jgi:isoaspartyl peptidase/L-asparaginase-like protein (Ntn-hydrolase superfamily)